MLHVAVVNRHPHDAIGGSELQCDLFARGLTALGHRVTYVALHADGPGPEGSSIPYEVVRIGGDSAGDPASIAGAVLAAGADVVYWRYGRELLDHVARELAQVTPRVPLVLAVAHVDDVSRWPTGPIARASTRDLVSDVRRRITHRRSWRAFSYVRAVAAQREDFLGCVPVALQQHVPNVVDPSVAAFAWPRPYVAWVANLKARKRPEHLVPLAQVLAPHGVDLVVAGAVQDERYRRLTSHDPRHPNLHPLGPLAPSAAAGLIAGARCLAVTSRPEGLSNAMIQAWWHGVPTVSLDYDPDGAITEHGLGAACAGDEDAFRFAVLGYATDEAMRDAAGVRSRHYAGERFALERNVGRLERLLREATRDARLTRPTSE